MTDLESNWDVIVIGGGITGAGIALDASFLELGDAVRDSDKWPKLLLYIAAAIFLLVATTRLRRAWALPLASLVLVAVFYITAAVKGLGADELVAGGWLFDIPEEGGALALLSGVSFARIDTGFVLTVVPQILTIAFLALPLRRDREEPGDAQGTDRPAAEEVAALDMAFENLGPQLTDFADTAGLLAHLDLIITIDTSVAHLAGAMGKLGTVGLASAVFSPWMNISGSILANYWRAHPPKD